MAFGGDGVGKLEGEVCFIPGVLPGEIVRAKIKVQKANHVKAVPLELLERSPDRVDPVCPWAGTVAANGQIRPAVCPGCSYQHTSYPTELKLKQQQFEELFRHTAGLEDVEFLPPEPSPKELGYRNKITMHTELDEGVMRLGYYMGDNQSILEVENCPLASEGINKLLAETRAQPGFRHSIHKNMTVTLRETANDGVQLWRNNPPSRMSWLKEETPVGTISVPAGSFFQINPDGGAMLINKVGEMLDKLEPSYVIDLYCGVGIFGVTAAKHGAQQIFGIDSDGPAITAAEYNLKNSGAESYKLLTGTVEKTLKTIADCYDPENTTLIVDPPRTGIARSVIQHLCNTGIANIIYISCGPDTLCRDLKILTDNGYKIVHTQLVDMFPRTAHFESITLLTVDDQ